MQKTISSPVTFLFKIVIPIAFTLATVSALTIVLKDNFKIETIITTIFLSFIGIIIYFHCSKLKEVKIDDNYFYISDYSKKIKLHKKEVLKIEEFIARRTKLIILHLKRETIFGKQIIFIPKGTAFFYEPNPLVTELEEFIKN